MPTITPFREYTCGMLIPYSTDAPIYHLPFATVGLIVVNVAVFGISAVAVTEFESVEPFLLQFDRISALAMGHYEFHACRNHALAWQHDFHVGILSDR